MVITMMITPSSSGIPISSWRWNARRAYALTGWHPRPCGSWRTVHREPRTAHSLGHQSRTGHTERTRTLKSQHRNATVEQLRATFQSMTVQRSIPREDALARKLVPRTGSWARAQTRESIKKTHQGLPAHALLALTPSHRTSPANKYKPMKSQKYRIQLYREPP